MEATGSRFSLEGLSVQNHTIVALHVRYSFNTSILQWSLLASVATFRQKCLHQLMRLMYQDVYLGTESYLTSMIIISKSYTKITPHEINRRKLPPPGGSLRMPWNPSVSNATDSLDVGDGHRVLLDFRHPGNREGPRRSVNPAPGWVYDSVGADVLLFKAVPFKGERSVETMCFLIGKWYSSAESSCIYRYQNILYSI